MSSKCQKEMQPNYEVKIGKELLYKASEYSIEL